MPALSLSGLSSSARARLLPLTAALLPVPPPLSPRAAPLAASGKDHACLLAGVAMLSELPCMCARVRAGCAHAALWLGDSSGACPPAEVMSAIGPLVSFVSA